MSSDRTVHELAVLRSIVDAVSEHARGDVVTRVSLGVGLQSGCSPHAIQFCFELATRGTVLAGAELAIDVLPGRQLMIHSIEVI
jgi:hydrogenase nickel incorporation protein HypA/HybF